MKRTRHVESHQTVLSSKSIPPRALESLAKGRQSAFNANGFGIHRWGMPLNPDQIPDDEIETGSRVIASFF